VPAGAPLLEIGDPLDLEVIADLLSTDAVQVKLGSPVRIDGWGGSTIKGRVTRVDPAGFLKVSALGIEEQRVRTTIDFVEPSEAWSRLGHDYRVIVHVTVVAPWPRLPGDRSCHGMEHPGGADGAGRLAVPKG
jgi:HlyD family secretion protein